ncbi:MAG: potassium transporter [Phycisphaerae bacterium]|nr:potassium transporter [Phycisphaerae bacterium]|tara:strand:+ start:7098 stop:7556 length:459 start_codon:yes stop_codon:yes gene_type:complete
MIASVLISVTLVLITTGVRLAFFVIAARYTLDADRFTWHRFFCLMLGIYASHLFDIVVYAVAYYFAWHALDIGTLTGERTDGPLGHFYASAVMYTTIGFGDILPTGHLRFIAATQGLSGLLYIAWSASFIFAAMNRMLKDRNAISGKTNDDD